MGGFWLRGRYDGPPDESGADSAMPQAHGSRSSNLFLVALPIILWPDQPLPEELPWVMSSLQGALGPI